MDAVRIVNRIVSAVLALLLAVGGVLVAVEVVLASLDRDPWILPHDRWLRTARETAWSDRSAVLAFVLLVLVGLVLLVLELLRRRTPALTMAPHSDAVHADLDRRGVERWLASRLTGVEGVDAPRAKVGKSAVDVRAETPQGDAGEVEQRLQQAAQSALDELDLAAPLTARVKVQSRRHA
jgi:Family of unknown function (DUF6286)